MNKQELINSKRTYSISVSGDELSKALTTENGIYDLSLKIVQRLIEVSKVDDYIIASMYKSERSDHYE